MEEERKEKKTIKCSYAVLVIILFAALAFVTDYAYIERKTRKCDCPKCEATNNEVISDSTDNTQVTENDNKDINVLVKNIFFNCIEKKDGYCLLADTNSKIELKNNSNNTAIKYNSIIVNGNEYSLDGNDGFYRVEETVDENVFVEFVHDSVIYYILLDENANKLSDFKEFYEEGYNNRVYYIDGIYKIYSFYGHGSQFNLCGYVDDEKIVDIEKEYRHIESGNFEMINKEMYTLNEIIARDKEYTGFSSCEEYMNGY